MTGKETAKAGPVTLALGLIAGGVVLLLHNFGLIKSLDWLWKLWPVILIAVGAEYFIKKALSQEDVKFHVPSLFLIVILIIAGGVGYAAANLGKNLDGIVDGLPWNENLTYSRTWEAESVVMQAGEELLIENKTGKIKLLQASGNELKVKAIIRSRENGSSRELAEKLNPSVNKEGSRVSVRVPEISDMRNIAVDFEVTVPPQVNMVVDSGVGRLTAERLSNNLSVNGSAGSIEVREINGNLEIENNTGRVEVYEPGGDLLAKNNTGSIEVKSERPLSGKYELKSNTGRVSLEMTRTSNLTIEAKAQTGSINLEGIDGNVEGSGPSKKYNQTVGNGKGQAKLEVGTGSISIKVR